MRTRELVRQVAKRCDISKVEARVFLEELSGVIMENVMSGKTVPLLGIGRFYMTRCRHTGTYGTQIRDFLRFRPSKLLNQKLKDTGG